MLKSRIKSIKERVVKNKYLVFDDEYISGWQYFLRSLWQTLVIPVFGLGLYLLAVTAYKRGRSIGYKILWIWGVWGALVIPFSFWYNTTQAGNDAPEILGTFDLIEFVFCTFPHLSLWWRNGNRIKTLY